MLSSRRPCGRSARNAAIAAGRLPAPTGGRHVIGSCGEGNSRNSVEEMEQQEEEGVIERRHSLTREVFLSEYVSFNKPVVVRLKDVERKHGMPFKTLKRKWGSLDGWKRSALAKEDVVVITERYQSSRCGVNMTLAQYFERFNEWRVPISEIEFRRNDSKVGSLVARDVGDANWPKESASRGRDEDGAEDKERQSTAKERYVAVPYLSDFEFWKFEGGIELLKDLWGPEGVPEFLEDWILRYNLQLDFDFVKKRQNQQDKKKRIWRPKRTRDPHITEEDHSIRFNIPFCYLFIGPRGAMSKLHTDDHTTHGWLLQLVGRKRFTFWTPNQFPYDKYTPTEVILQPFDMLYVPFRWAHEVTALDDSVSLQWRHLCTECADGVPLAPEVQKSK